MHIHLLGIGGTLMGSIALLAQAQGHRVTGSDSAVYEPMRSQLAAANINVQSPYLKTSIPDTAELIVLGNAGLGRGNPAVEALLSSGKPFESGASFLGQYILKDKWVIAASGTHGKTTTASLITWLLEHAGLNPSYLIGGVPLNFKTSARLTDSPFFVIEADEYDTSYFDRQSKFLHYRPKTLVINNLEYDHADIFPDLKSIENQFHQLVRRVPEMGQIISNGFDDNVAQLLNRGLWSEHRRYGVSDLLSDSSKFDLFMQSSTGNVVVDGQMIGTRSWTLTGEHNDANALAAIAAARHVGVPVHESLAALTEFQGVKRRMEVLVDAEKYRLYDDFAHHPTAIKSTLAGLRSSVGSAPIYAIIEPASHTMRLGTHEQQLSDACQPADRVYWLHERQLNFDLEGLVSGDGQRVFQDPQLLARALSADLNDESSLAHIVIMSNGGIESLTSALASQLTHA
jgi:UDP-N-acetylmuramate: L-alanyl-gamma-D-glutamyl-meso-diaminopimelate ligase